jgi:hypothetical protein
MWMGPGASRSSKWRGFVDVTDGSDGVDVLKVFSGVGLLDVVDDELRRAVRRSDF